MFSKEDIVGLDIGSSSIKAVQLTHTPGTAYTLTALGIEPLPPMAIKQGEIAYVEPITRAIEHLYQKYKIKGRKVALALTGHSVSVKRITLPLAPEDELVDMVRWEADQYLPSDPADAYIDFQILPSATKTDKLNILLVTAKKERVQKLVQLVQGAGLKPVVIDSGALALENQHEINYDKFDHNVVALVDIGASAISINILENDQTLFVNSIMGGGNDLTQALQVGLNVGQEQAEIIKQGKRTIDIDLSKVRKIVQQISEEMAVQIEHLFDCFTASHPGKDITLVLLSGGGALLQGLTRFLARRLKKPVELINPFKEIACKGEKYSSAELSRMGPLFAMGVGLALRRPDDKIYRPIVNI